MFWFETFKRFETVQEPDLETWPNSSYNPISLHVNSQLARVADFPNSSFSILYPNIFALPTELSDKNPLVTGPPGFNLQLEPSPWKGPISSRNFIGYHFRGLNNTRISVITISWQLARNLEPRSLVNSDRESNGYRSRTGVQESLKITQPRESPPIRYFHRKLVGPTCLTDILLARNMCIVYPNAQRLRTARTPEIYCSLRFKSAIMEPCIKFNSSRL